MKKFKITLKYGTDWQGKSLDKSFEEFAEDEKNAIRIGFGCDDAALGTPDDVEVEEVEADPYELACAQGAIRKAAMVKEISQCPAKYVSYGDGDLGKAILKADALGDIEALDDASIGDGTWYPCDANGKELTASQLAAAAMGSARSEAKTRTARENGARGGRPVEHTQKVENIRKAVLNGQQVKLFDLREFHDGAWVFAGTYSAPVRTANKRLLESIEV